MWRTVTARFYPNAFFGLQVHYNTFTIHQSPFSAMAESTIHELISANVLCVADRSRHIALLYMAKVYAAPVAFDSKSQTSD